jgi:uncharacterized protein YoxC
MTQSKRRGAGEQGQAAFSLVIVLIVVAIAVVLLQRTASTAESINKKADNIAKTGRGINTATDAVLQLDTTNKLAGSILQTAQPLQGKLAEIVRLAQDVDGLASSINGSAGTINQTAVAINGTAGTIGGTAKGINGTAASILDVAKSINAGVAQINRNLEGTLAIAQRIKGDTGNILGQANTAHKEAACISGGLVLTPGGADGDCHA